MRKLRHWIQVLLAVLLMTGCTEPSAGSVDPTQFQSVENIFTEPTVSTEIQTAPATPNINAGNYFGIANEILKDESGSYLVYEGGEMHLFLRMRIEGLHDKNIGIHLYVDGRPQPYHTPENETAQYMQIYPSMNGKTFTLELIFTPVTGQAGDTLELGCVIVADPAYFIDDSLTGTTIMDWCGMGLTIRTKYLADPPAAELPAVNDRMIWLSQEYTDLMASEAEMFSSGEYRKEVAYEIYVNHKESFGNIFSVTEEDKLEVEFELKGSAMADFGLVMYLDHQPVSVREEDLTFLRTQNGKKVTVKAEIDLSGFDGEGIFYAVIVPRNYRIDQLGSSCLLTILGPYYLSGAESLEALQGTE